MPALKALIHSTEFPPGPGGIGTHAYQIARHLTTLGWQVEVLSPQDYAEDSEILAFSRSVPFQIHRAHHAAIRVVEGLSRFIDQGRRVREYSPDVILASGSQAVVLTAAQSGTPWVAIGHGGEFAQMQGLYGSLSHWAYNRAHAIICVSNYTRERMEKATVRVSDVTVIYNGADETIYKPLDDSLITSFRERHGLGNDPILLTVGNVSDRKGQDIVIRALPIILQKVPNLRYVIIGLGTVKDQYAALADELGVSGNVHFLGRVGNDEAVEACNACDLFVMTSRYAKDGDFEGFGIAVIEAALCGKAAVVTRGSGLAEAVIDGGTGLLVNQEDPQDTARAILELLQQELLRIRLGAAAQERALDKLTWSKVARGYDSVLKRLAGDRV